MSGAARSLNGRAPSMASLSERLHAVELAAVEDRSKLGTHEEVCAERYAKINGKLDDLQGSAKATEKAVQNLTDASNIAIGVERGTARASRPKWWAEPVLIVVLSGAMALGGWLGGHVVEAALKAPVAATAKAN